MNPAEHDHLVAQQHKDTGVVEDDDLATALVLAFAIGVLIFVAGAVVGHFTYPWVHGLLF